MNTSSARERLRRLGQADLGAWIEVATKQRLWSIQKRIASAVSRPRSHVIVPSCNSSGKTWLAARIALAFYDAFFPGTPCLACKGPCRGAKIITTSSKETHLRDNMWGELRTVFPLIAKEVGMDGRLFEGALRLEGAPDHFIIGQSAATAEGMQGYHQAHKLIIGDEATALSEEVAQGITGLLASGDARLLLVFNPTGPDTYAAAQARSTRSDVIRIRAWDTPYFTGEPVPPGANLITPGFLEDLKASGMGPGSYEWTTRVEAEFWSVSEGALLDPQWVQRAWRPGTVSNDQLLRPVRQFGIDLATYGNNESVVAVREGDALVALHAFPPMRLDVFFSGPVKELVERWVPHYVVWDADGVGAGAVGYIEDATRTLGSQVSLLPFRGAKSINDWSNNARSAWWWGLRRRFESGEIHLAIPRDAKLESQLQQMTYTVDGGKIRVVSKAEMKRQGLESPDRADAVMYAFSLSEALVDPSAPGATSLPSWFDEEFPSIRNRDVDDPEHLFAAEESWYGDEHEINPLTGVGF